MSRKKLELDLSGLSTTDQIIRCLKHTDKVVKYAKKNKQSLVGSTSHDIRFHKCHSEARRAFKEVEGRLRPRADPALQRTLSDIDRELTLFFNPKLDSKDRNDLRAEIELLITSEVEPALSQINMNETEFIPINIVRGTRNYVENVTRQINTCYQCNCFDACGVMTRRLLEILIIEVFLRKGLEARISDNKGNYFMYKDLVAKLVNTKEVPVGKPTRTKLPRTIDVLNNCAHGRAFNIGKDQLDQHKDTIVTAVQELTNLWDVHNSEPS